MKAHDLNKDLHKDKEAGEINIKIERLRNMILPRAIFNLCSFSDPVASPLSSEGWCCLINESFGKLYA